MYNQYKLPTKAISNSILHHLRCLIAAKAGKHITRIPYDVLSQMVNHPHIISALAVFSTMGDVFLNDE